MIREMRRHAAHAPTGCQAHQSADVCTVCIITRSESRRVTTDQHTLPSLSSHFSQHFRTMGAKQSICCLVPSPLPSPANVPFRVLIIGRANAGKTSILQRVCDTTESPEVYKSGPGGTRDLVRAHFQCPFQSHGLSRSLLIPR